MSEVLDNRTQIGHRLLRLVDSRAPLTLSSARAARPASSLLLRVDFDADVIILDDPLPQLPLTPGERLQIMGRADGAVTQFESPLLRLENAPGGTVLVVGFPRTVSHTERRGAHRVPIPHTLNLPPPVLAGATGAFEGRLLDVSEGGFGALAMTAQLPQIGSLLACTMSLPGAKLLADARICSALREDGAGRLGLRFTALSASQIDALRRAVARLDRQALRQASAVLG